jgi:hypothetical protein
MGSQDRARAPREEVGATEEALGQERPAVGGIAAAVSWRRVSNAVLVASGAFLALFVLGTALPVFFFASAVVFLPVAIWLGRSSPRPVLDGAVYGVAAGAIAFVVILLGGFDLQVWGLVFAFFLGIPQGVFGAWLGARYLSTAGVPKAPRTTVAPLPSPDASADSTSADAEASTGEAPPVEGG